MSSQYGQLICYRLNQYGWESVIAGIPHPTAIIFECDGEILNSTTNPANISEFTSSFSFKTGLAKWSYTWTPQCVTYNVSFSAFVSRQRPNVLAVEARIMSDLGSRTCSVTDLLDGRGAFRTTFAGNGLVNDSMGNTIWTAVHPENLYNVTAYIYSTFISEETNRELVNDSTQESTIGQRFGLNMVPKQQKVFHKFVGIASTNKFNNAQSVAMQASEQASNNGWTALLTEHTQAWGSIMNEDSIDNFTHPTTGVLQDDEYSEILQISSLANAFYLLQNLQPAGTELNDNSIAVGGLTSDAYGGMVFWDADYWMAPGIGISQPRFVTQIGNLRIKQFQQAQRNAESNEFPAGSALYPWTSGRYGNCTGTGPCVDYEYHLNADIAFSLAQIYDVTNNKTWFDQEGGPRQIIYAIALAASHILSYNNDTKTYWIYNMTDPDEYANNVNNGAFTLASFAALLDLANVYRVEEGLQPNDTWQRMSTNVQFTRSQTGLTLEFDHMNANISVKQIDVGLLTYPLNYKKNNYTIDDMAQDVEYYATVQSNVGPAMTWSMFAIDELATDPTGCASFTYTVRAMEPYLRAPWFQFSEQANDDYMMNDGTNPAFPFLTGHGGAHQIAPFGFLGIRTNSMNRTLSVNPSLPPQIPYVRLRDVYYAGARLATVMNQTHTTITRLATTTADGVIDRYKGNMMPIRHWSTTNITHSDASTIIYGSDPDIYYLAINQTITLRNRQPYLILANSNSLQCLPIPATSSMPSVVNNQAPMSIIDGSNATRWQPTYNNISSVWIDTRTTNKTFRQVREVFINWAERPALYARVVIGNGTVTNSILNSPFVGDSLEISKLSTQQSNHTIITLPSIEISEPYNATFDGYE